MLVITIINYRGGRTAAWFQDLMTAGLIILTAIFVFAGVTGGSVANLEPMFTGATPGAAFAGVAVVFATAAWWFAGFDTIPQAMEEVEEGSRLRLIPRVIGASIVFAMVFYLLVILATAMSLPRPELLASELPAEWIVLGVWCVLGLVFYRAAAPLRKAVSARQLRWLDLNEDDSQANDQ